MESSSDSEGSRPDMTLMTLSMSFLSLLNEWMDSQSWFLGEHCFQLEGKVKAAIQELLIRPRFFLHYIVIVD